MSDAPALILLHGFTGSGAGWQPVVSGLRERYLAIAPDIRGHATASDLRPVTLAAVLDDIEQALTAAGVRQDAGLAITGYSQGGRIALHAALDPRFARRLQKLVLIGSSPGLNDPKARAARRAADEQLAAQFEAMTISELADHWARTPILGGITSTQAAAARAERLKSTPAGLAAALRGLGTGALPSLWERLIEITAPVTLIAGERDTKFQQTHASMAALLPNATVHVAAGAGHAAALEQPDLVAELIAGSR